MPGLRVLLAKREDKRVTRISSFLVVFAGRNRAIKGVAMVVRTGSDTYSFDFEIDSREIIKPMIKVSMERIFQHISNTCISNR